MRYFFGSGKIDVNLLLFFIIFYYYFPCAISPSHLIFYYQKYMSTFTNPPGNAFPAGQYVNLSGGGGSGRPIPYAGFSFSKSYPDVMPVVLPSPEMGLKDAYSLLLEYGTFLYNAENHKICESVSDESCKIITVLKRAMDLLCEHIKRKESREQEKCEGLYREQKQ